MNKTYKSGLSVRAINTIRCLVPHSSSEDVGYNNAEHNWIIPEEVKDILRHIPLYEFWRAQNCGEVTIREIFEWLGRDDFPKKTHKLCPHCGGKLP